MIIDSQLQSSENPTIIFKNCKRRENGIGGEPGLGGKNGTKYRGIYINEAVFPQLRGINPKDLNAETKNHREEKGGFKIMDFRVLSQEAAEEVTKQGGKVIVKDVLKIGVTESGKNIGNSLASMAMDGSFAVKGVLFPISAISAYLSSYWEKEVHEINNDIKYASKGESPIGFNYRNIKKPSDQSFINEEEQDALYNQFYKQKKRDL